MAKGTARPMRAVTSKLGPIWPRTLPRQHKTCEPAWQRGLRGPSDQINIPFPLKFKFGLRWTSQLTHSITARASRISRLYSHAAMSLAVPRQPMPQSSCNLCPPHSPRRCRRWPLCRCLGRTTSRPRSGSSNRLGRAARARAGAASSSEKPPAFP